MQHLTEITPSAEQLRILSTNQLGAELIRGAAGSGKTTTALLRLRSLSHMMKARKDRLSDDTPLRILLLTFNRTLSGYVQALASNQLARFAHEMEISTFAKWALKNLGNPEVDEGAARRKLASLTSTFGSLDPTYLTNEVEYVLGRFPPDRLEDYIVSERTGRGTLPRVDSQLRRKILDDVIYPYLGYLEENNLLDWNSLAIRMTKDVPCLEYDIVIVDESQDFSANEIRAINHHLASHHAITFVIDTVQRIYARGFTWAEAGINIAPNRSHRLQENHRNTRQIAHFAAGILDGLPVDNDGVLPDLEAASTDGIPPTIVTGYYSQQVAWAMQFINENIDLEKESVAFLKPQGGRWFDYLKDQLGSNHIEYCDITRNPEWPDDEINVALSTFHSVKGLEFDYVFILGFNQENTDYQDEEDSDQIRVLRNLLAVAVARARKQVFVGYKPEEKSDLVFHFADGTFNEVNL